MFVAFSVLISFQSGRKKCSTLFTKTFSFVLFFVFFETPRLRSQTMRHVSQNYIEISALPTSQGAYFFRNNDICWRETFRSVWFATFSLRLPCIASLSKKEVQLKSFFATQVPERSGGGATGGKAPERVSGG